MGLYFEVPVIKKGDSGELEWACPRPSCLGVMKYTGEVALVSPPAYVHRCDVCDQKFSLKGAVFGNPYGNESSDSNKPQDY